MGYSYRNNGQITDWWPDDTEEEFYVAEDATLSDILNSCHERWPGFHPEKIRITPEYLHTSCLYYDLYDAGDYTHFLRISRIK